jgi:hypothetical protein
MDISLGVLIEVTEIRVNKNPITKGFLATYLKVWL